MLFYSSAKHLFQLIKCFLHRISTKKKLYRSQRCSKLPWQHLQQLHYSPRKWPEHTFKKIIFLQDVLALFASLNMQALKSCLKANSLHHYYWCLIITGMYYYWAKCPQRTFESLGLAAYSQKCGTFSPTRLYANKILFAWLFPSPWGTSYCRWLPSLEPFWCSLFPAVQFLRQLYANHNKSQCLRCVSHDWMAHLHSLNYEVPGSRMTLALQPENTITTKMNK